MDPRNIRKPAPEAVTVTAPSLEEAYRLVREKGIPFREAYREVAKRYAAS